MMRNNPHHQTNVRFNINHFILKKVMEFRNKMDFNTYNILRRKVKGDVSMMIELHGMIENDSDIYSALTQCGKLEMIDKLEIEKSSYNDFTDETYYYKEYIYTYNYKPFKGMETLAQNIVNILWNYDIFN